MKLQAESSPIMDRNPNLNPFCDILELIFRKGIRQPVLGLKRRDYWHLLEQLAHHHSCGELIQLTVALEKTIANKKTLTPQGQGRYFIRLALNQKSLATTIRHLLHTPKLSEFGVSFRMSNFLLYTEPFLSLLLVVSQMNFALDLEAVFAQVCELYETVPCRDLGMALRYVEKRIFVSEVIAGSQAEADGCVLAGDIIDEINGISTRNAQKGQAQSVLQKLRGKPLCFRLIRWKCHDGSIYRPLVPHLQVLQQDIPNFQLKYDNTLNEEKPEAIVQDGRFLYSLRYLGQVNIGTYGGKEVLDEGITKVLEQNHVPQEVLFDVKETEVISLKKDFSQVLFHHHYPEISSVGHRVDKRTLFAYCVADSPETPHTCSFICLVFETKSEKDADEIIMRIGECIRGWIYLIFFPTCAGTMSRMASSCAVIFYNYNYTSYKRGRGLSQ
uniref:Si:ch211-250n8.1 n=1 Tax=Callorhinchus milii TaxID=7868 RepID=A0A4W3K9W5_CALMI